MWPVLVVIGILWLSSGEKKEKPPAPGTPPGIETRSLNDLYPAFRSRLDRLISSLRASGFKPYVRATWRDPVRQRYYHDIGQSKVLQSYHTVTSAPLANGSRRPESLAADLNDSRWNADDPKQAPFYRELMRRAPEFGLVTGGTWTSERWPNDPEGKLGWDPGHVEVADGPTIAQAHAGARPFAESPAVA